MPIFEFRCPACGHTFEELVLRRSDREELVCPRCGAPNMDQMMSSFAAGSPSRGGSSSAGGSSGGSCGSGSFS